MSVWRFHPINQSRWSSWPFTKSPKWMPEYSIRHLFSSLFSSLAELISKTNLCIYSIWREEMSKSLDSSSLSCFFIIYPEHWRRRKRGQCDLRAGVQCYRGYRLFQPLDENSGHKQFHFLSILLKQKQFLSTYK